MSQRKVISRIPEVDGLRGLAAVSVVFLHLALAFHNRPHRWYLAPFFSGSQAVILFFVLSGFVLSLPFWAGRRTSYVKYALARTARIYLPFAVAAALSIAGAYLFRHRHLDLTTWFNETWHQPITLRSIVDQFLMWPVPQYNTALWSLRYEMQVSLVFPPLMWLCRRFNPLGLTGAALTFCFYNTETLQKHLGWHTANRTLCVASLFLVRVCAAHYREVIVATLRASAASRWLLFSGFIRALQRIRRNARYGCEVAAVRRWRAWTDPRFRLQHYSGQTAKFKGLRLSWPHLLQPLPYSQRRAL